MMETNEGTQAHGLLHSLVAPSKPARYRIPDVMIVERPYTKGRVVVDVPAVVIERCLEYAALSVPNIVVLDPEAKRQYRFVNRSLELVSRTILHLPKNGADLEFPAGELFAELDEE